MQNDANTLLRLENLSADIGRQAILCDINLTIQHGECLAVVGGSGAGKSTLLRCLMGLRHPAKPTAGRLIFHGHTLDLATAKKRVKLKGMGYVPQNPDHGFDPLKRLKWQWRQAARVVTGKAEFSEAHERLLSELGLKPFGNRFPHEWSRGMQQRLLLAMVLMGKPQLLILDEPTSALDPLIAAQVLRAVMKYAQAHGVAVLIVTHDLALAARYADRTAIMNAGRIVEFGETTTLLTHPQSDYGQLLAANRDWTSVADEHGPIAAE